jgi:hypothetical protein
MGDQIGLFTESALLIVKMLVGLLRRERMIGHVSASTTTEMSHFLRMHIKAYLTVIPFCHEEILKYTPCMTYTVGLNVVTFLFNSVLAIRITLDSIT